MAVKLIKPFTCIPASFPVILVIIRFSFNMWALGIATGSVATKDNNAIKATHARYCILTKCQNRNLTIADRYIGITTNSKSRIIGLNSFNKTNLTFSCLKFLCTSVFNRHKKTVLKDK
jgi:hypothetical protein